MPEDVPGPDEGIGLSGSPYTIRAAQDDDAAPLCGILNEIIRIGGTTAIEDELDPDTFRQYFLSGPNRLCCMVAEAPDGTLFGFQFLGSHADLPHDCGDISTFARQKPRSRGVGTALFAATLEIAGQLGLETINATIRADNTGGLAYYSKMGLQDDSLAPAVPLRSGKAVDRVSKRYRIR
jgi:L-amino acid N-acyltransferase YncA